MEWIDDKGNRNAKYNAKLTNFLVIVWRYPLLPLQVTNLQHLYWAFILCLFLGVRYTRRYIVPMGFGGSEWS
jgi:hypothetical protein